MVLERPLVGEPLGLDLLNTRWLNRGVPQDVLGDLAGTRLWLDQAGLADTETELTRQALRTAREAIGTHIDQPESPSARAALNEVLAWGRSWPVLGPDGPDTAVALDEPSQHAGWLAAVNYLELLAADPTRVRRCAHPECVLHFYDTSPKRSRRWCSMAGCGNRAKAARHYAKARTN
jgi:predicted RNA-binding Zn ribbon-like protein